MKLDKISLENYRSFKEKQTFQIDGNISILIGPNGGGKSNLLDVTLLLLRRYIFPSWLVEEPQTYNSPLPRIVPNETDSNPYLRKHSDAESDPQTAEFTIEVTSQDVISIKNIIDHEAELRNALSTKYTGVTFPNIESWKLNTPTAGLKVLVRISSNSIEDQSYPQAKTFLEYLHNFEWIARLRSELDTDALPTPILSLPANRSSNNMIFEIGLAGWQESNFKRHVDLSNSRLQTNIVQLAIGRLASRFVDILHSNQANAQDIFMRTAEAQGLTKSLGTLGYKWNLKCKNRQNNDYTIELEKGTRKFLVDQASSGEKEILVLLFAIFGLNVRDAVVIVDEPELHLHPRLQKKIYQLLEQLAETTANQFILATHSATFVSPSSIQYVSRVYNENGESKIIRLNDADLPNSKHLFNIVNSQNNESLFFADHVLLVEGLSDKIFFEKALDLFYKNTLDKSTVEIIPVGGKGLFRAYEKLLKACKVRYSILADQDYLEQVGSEAIKKMLSTDVNGIKKHVIEDPTSRDGTALVQHIEQALTSGNWDHARDVWEYIKSRRLRIQPELTIEQNNQIKDFIEQKRNDGVYILSRGALESYLPSGYLSKDIEKLIELLEEKEFWRILPENEWKEISSIMSHLTTERIDRLS
ncbi:AAA family ATPase [Pseudomonas putida]|uniref:AAA family ATPase n=1 Tax=Pseudomonas putida TaxID=303 RepID=UPI001E3CE4B1|nr:AAA family ATPase [Pseudomonas putida]MCE0963473.1 AAA family ATPase [Pseudomonas putida]